MERGNRKSSKEATIAEKATSADARVAKEKPEKVPGADEVKRQSWKRADEPTKSTHDGAADQTKETQATSAEVNDPDQTAAEYDEVEEPVSSKWYHQLPEDNMNDEPNEDTARPSSSSRARARRTKNSQQKRGGGWRRLQMKFLWKHLRESAQCL